MMLNSRSKSLNAKSALILGALMLSSQVAMANSTVNSVDFGTNKTRYVAGKNIPSIIPGFIPDTKIDDLSINSSSNAFGLLTGREGDVWRQYLVFDLNAANFQVRDNQPVYLDFTFQFSGNGNGSSATLNFWDANASYANINTGQNTPGAFADLGSGANYGSILFNGNGNDQSFTLRVVLNQAAINNLKTGGKFVIGVDANANNFLSGALRNAKISAVPLPPAALLFGPAVFAFGAMKRKRASSAQDLV